MPLITLQDNHIAGSVFISIEAVINTLFESEAESHKKKWHSLYKTHYPESFSLQGLAQLITLALIDITRAGEAVDFPCWIYKEEKGGHPLYSIISPNEAFNDAFCDTFQDMIRTTLLEEPLKSERQNEIKAKMQEALNKFSCRSSINLSGNLNYARVRADPRRKEVRLETISPRSSAFSDYPNQVTTTDELFEFASALENSETVYSGNVEDLASSSGALIKFILYYLEYKSIDPGRVMVNRSDQGDWDYRYDAIDSQFSK